MRAGAALVCLSGDQLLGKLGVAAAIERDGSTTLAAASAPASGGSGRAARRA